MFHLVDIVLASALAASGTKTFGYPTGMLKGNFLGSYGHKATALGALLSAPEDFTLTFGDTEITFTLGAGRTTIASGKTIRVQVEERGEDDLQPDSISGLNNVSFAPSVFVNLGSPLILDADGLIVAATTTELPDAAAPGETVTYTFPVTAANVSPQDGVNQTGVLDVPRAVNTVVTHASSIVAMTILYSGYDEYDVAMSELHTITATGTSKTVAGTKAFKRIITIAITAAADAGANTLNSGWSDVLGLPVFVGSASDLLVEYKDGARVALMSDKVRLPWVLDQIDLLAPTPVELRSPVAGRITRCVSTVQAAVTTGGAITVEVDTVAVDGLSVVVADSAAAGDLDSDTPTAGHASALVAVDSRIEILPAAAFATAGRLAGYLEIDPTPAAYSTLVAGVLSKATTTTGDIRGTYDPAAACDGVANFAFLAALPDPKFAGVRQA